MCGYWGPNPGPCGCAPSALPTQPISPAIVSEAHDLAHSENVTRILAFCRHRWGPGIFQPNIAPTTMPAFFAYLLWVFSESGLFTVGKDYPAISRAPKNLRVSTGRLLCAWSANALLHRRAMPLTALYTGLSRHWATSAFPSLSWHQRR